MHTHVCLGLVSNRQLKLAQGRGRAQPFQDQDFALERVWLCIVSNHDVHRQITSCAGQTGKAALLGVGMEDADQSQPGEQLLEECMAVFVELCHAFAIKARLMRMNSIREVGVFH